MTDNKHDDALASTQDRRDVIGTLNEFSPDFVSIISECCIEKVFDRPMLPQQMKEVVAVVSLISLGSDRLKGHFESALQAGMKLDELKEVVMLSAIYLGFPRAIDAMLQLNETVASLSEA